MARVGVSPEGAGGAGVRGPQQAGPGEETRPDYPPAPAGVGDSRRRRRGRGQAARAASVQERHVVRRQAGLDEAARHVGRDDGVPAGAGPCRRGEDRAGARLGRPAALLHGRGGAVRACRSSARLRRGRGRDGGRARGARARGRRARGGLARAPRPRRRGQRGLPRAARGRPALRGDPVHARPQAAAGGRPRGRPGAARRRPGPAARRGVRPCLRGPHPRRDRGRCGDRARDRGGPRVPGCGSSLRARGWRRSWWSSPSRGPGSASSPAQAVRRCSPAGTARRCRPGATSRPSAPVPSASSPPARCSHRPPPSRRGCSPTRPVRWNCWSSSTRRTRPACGRRASRLRSSRVPRPRI